MSDFQNEDGEFLMTAAELRTEWELDQQSAAEAWEERWLDQDDAFEVDEGDFFEDDGDWDEPMCWPNV